MHGSELGKEEGDDTLDKCCTNFQAVQALMLYAAALRQQADESVINCCDSAEGDFADFTAAQQLFLKAAGVYSWILFNLLASKDANEGK